MGQQGGVPFGRYGVTMEDEKSEGADTGVAEESALEAVETPTALPSRRSVPVIWAIVTAVGVLAVAAAATFGVLWISTSADLRESESSLAEATERVSEAEATSSS